MRTEVMYHRDTGHTRELAEYMARQTGADRVQVRSRFPYNHLFRMIEGDRLWRNHRFYDRPLLGATASDASAPAARASPHRDRPTES